MGRHLMYHRLRSTCQSKPPRLKWIFVFNLSFLCFLGLERVRGLKVEVGLVADYSEIDNYFIIETMGYYRD